MRRLLLSILGGLVAFSGSGCFTLAVKGGEVAGKEAAKTDVPVLKQAGEATEKGAEKIEDTEKQMIHKVEDAVR